MHPSTSDETTSNSSHSEISDTSRPYPAVKEIEKHRMLESVRLFLDNFAEMYRKTSWKLNIGPQKIGNLVGKKKDCNTIWHNSTNVTKESA